ncbi:WD40/YVTN/BNR-like repeat-containing protein [Gracilimonas sp. BCB1]|uniref:WD40/YVTN/BNR-like repeat-containing protein n=1 Tax=Gracilimonas sp. BCB1 TaxID=3152362 RepID=UPI0032D8CCB2
MRYYKLIFIIVCFTLASCGTESTPGVWNLEWAQEGLEGEKINAIEYSETSLLLSSESKLFKKDMKADSVWRELNIKINPDTSEFGDILFMDFGLLAVVRNSIEFHELPNDYVSLYKSTDDGKSWEAMEVQFEGREPPFVINRIAKTNKEKEEIYADWHLIFKSTNEGGKWVNLTKSFRVGVSEFLYVSKDHPNQIWTGGWDNTFSPYLAKSETGGERWIDLSEKVYFNTDATVYSALVHSKNERKVLIGFGGSVETANVIRKSKDGGDTWETVLEGYSIRSIKNSENNPSRVYASGRSLQNKLFVAISEDYGDSWNIETYRESPSDIQTTEMVVTEIENKETLFLATNKGVYSLTFEE